MFGIKMRRRAGAPKGTPAELFDALRVLKASSPELFQRVLAYVLEGADAMVVSEIAGASDDLVFSLLGWPGEIGGTHSTTHPASELAARIDKADRGWSPVDSEAARRLLHERIVVLRPDQVVRLGRVLIAARRSKPQPRTSAAGPDWLPCLLVDALDPRDHIYSRDTERTVPWLAEHRTTWTPVFIVSLLESDGFETEEAVSITLATAFDRANLGSYWYRPPIDNLSRLAGTPEFVVAHRKRLRELVSDFTADGRREVIELTRRHPETLLPLLDVLAILLRDTSKGVRGDAIHALSVLPAAQQLELFEPLLLSAPAVAIADVIGAVSRIGDGSGAVERALAATDGAKGAAIARRREMLQTALERLRAVAAPAAEAADEITVPPYVRPAEPDLGDDFVTQTRQRLAVVLAELRKRAAMPLEPKATTWEKDDRKAAITHSAILSRVTEADIRAFAAYLSRGGAVPELVTEFNHRRFAGSFTGLTVLQAFRLHATGHGGDGTTQIPWWAISEDTAGGFDHDLRELADAAARVGFDAVTTDVARLCFTHYGNGLDRFAEEHIWPFFVEHSNLLADVLTSKGTWMRYGASSDDIATALTILGMMPSIPGHLVAPVVDLALGAGKSNRLAAQKVLETRPGAVALAVGALADRKLEIRVSTAQWLARLGDPATIAPLRAALAKEKRELVRAALLTSLEALGDDIAQELRPAALEAEATAGLANGVPAALAWFPFDALPPVCWASHGTAVPAQVVRWWLALALKLKEPGGGGLVGRYLTLLDGPSRAVLGEFALSAWIARDTRHPSEEESRAFADAEAPRRLQSTADMVKRYPQWYAETPEAKFTLDDFHAQARREHAATYVGSAIGEKGLLALASGTAGPVLVQAIQRFMKDHYLRRAQIEALLEVAAASDDLAATQLLLATSRRHRTKSVQNRARELVDKIAERRGWSTEELADRTIPTAGFDDDGVLRLNYGDRGFVGRITSRNTLELSDESGKVIKALPAARQSDEPEAVAEAKAQLSAAKKELKQQLGMQAGRLYEAMCAERAWPVADFAEFLLPHPLMSRLVSRLVWVFRSEAGVSTNILFRPDDTGQLIDAADDDVELPAGGIVQVAHASLMTAEERAAWQAHLADYDVTPLFEQLATEDPILAPVDGEIVDRKGWLTDSFTIRGAATKRGYQRGAGEDGGWFYQYLKPFTSLGIEVVIGFTGNPLPEENIPAAITTLSFNKLSTGWRTKPVVIGDVPPVLLAESYADYLAVAAAGTFDPEWEKKARW